MKVGRGWDAHILPFNNAFSMSKGFLSRNGNEHITVNHRYRDEKDGSMLLDRLGIILQTSFICFIIEVTI